MPAADGEDRTETWMKEKESKLHLVMDKQDIVSTVYVQEDM